MKASAWFVNNDMIVQLSNFKSSTASTYINSSTGVSCHVWKGFTTASTDNRLTTAAATLTYATGTNGTYRRAFQSTGTVGAGITSTVRGMAIITVDHSGLDAEFRVRFRGEFRGTT